MKNKTNLIKAGDTLFSGHDYDTQKGGIVEVTFVRWKTDGDNGNEEALGSDMLVEYEGKEIWLVSPYWITRERPVVNDGASDFLQKIGLGMSIEHDASIEITGSIENKTRKGSYITVRSGLAPATTYFVGIDKTVNKVIVEFINN